MHKCLGFQRAMVKVHILNVFNPLPGTEHSDSV